MALDGIILSKIREELVTSLPIRINKIQEVSANEFVFNVHGNNTRKNLIISTHSVYNRIHFTDKDYKLVDTPSSFVMALRKRIINGIIYEINQVNYDRYLELKIKAMNEMYDEKHYILNIELMGKYANIILIDEETNKIIDAHKKIPPFENTKRTIQIGAKFEQIELQNKKDLFDDVVDFDIPLSKQFHGVSPLLEKEINYRLSKGQTFSEIVNLIKESSNLYITKTDKNIEYHVIPLTMFNDHPIKLSINDGFDYIYYELEERERIKLLSNDLFKLIKKEIKHYQTKITKLHESLTLAEGADTFKDYGDFLFMSGQLDKKGLSSIEVYDYEGNNLSIQLDKKYTIKENANKYYQKYRKLKTSISYSLEQLEIAENNLEYLEMISEQLTIANYVDAMEIKDELVKYGYLKEKKNNNPRKKKDKAITSYKVQINNHTITFGKNNLQNEYVSFKLANKFDTWFHAKGYHGAHVVIDTDEPNEEEIRLCANIAAFFSKGREGSSIPVDYTLVRNLKKVKNKNNGFVSFDTNKTIYIDPDKEQLFSLGLI